MMYNKENPLKVITLCSGYDSQCLALERLKRNFPEFDYELIAWSEFDPESNSALDRQPAVIAHNALFPQWSNRNLGDMTKINWGGKTLNVTYLHIQHLAKVFHLLVSNMGSLRVVAHALQSFGSCAMRLKH